MSLKDTTLKIMAEHAKTEQDIDFITVDIYDTITSKYVAVEVVGREDFWDALAHTYDEGGDLSLKIVFKDRDYIERYEGYTGDVWWEYKTLLNKPTRSIRVRDSQIWEGKVHE